MLYELGVTHVTTADVLTLLEGTNDNFVLDRHAVFIFLGNLGVDVATLSTVELNKIMLELGIADVVIDTDLVADMLSIVGITDIDDATIEAALIAAEIDNTTELTKPDIITFLWEGLGVDYETLDPVAF